MPSKDVETGTAVLPLPARAKRGELQCAAAPRRAATPEATSELDERILHIDPRGEVDRVGIEALESLLNSMHEGEALIVRVSLADASPVRLTIAAADEAGERRQALEQTLDLATSLMGKRP